MESKFCHQCGAAQDATEAFCTRCGHGVENSPSLSDATNPVGGNPPPSREGKGTIPAGLDREMQLGQFMAEIPVHSQPIASIKPLPYLFKGVGRLFQGVPHVFKDKRKLVFFILITVVWTLLLLLDIAGEEKQMLRWMSFLTFARGGLSGGWPGIVGGALGKGVVASFFSLVFLAPLYKRNPFSGFGRGFGSFFRTFAVKDMRQLSLMLAGAGFSLAIFNFFAGNAFFENSMVGIGAFFLTIRSMGVKDSFFRGLLFSLKRRDKEEKRVEQTFVNPLLAGCASGFFIGVVLSRTNVVYIGYVAGAAVFAVAIALLVFSAIRKTDVRHIPGGRA